jgi:hypothetical protein
MPIRQVALLLGLFCLCLAIIGIAWASGSELFLFIPTRRGWAHHPPTHPGILLAVLVASLVLTVWIGQRGIYFFGIFAVGMLLGSAVGFFAYAWTPSWAQHVLCVTLIATTIYAWTQKDYFDE